MQRVHRIPRSTFVTTRPPLLMSTGRGKTIIYLRKTEEEYFSPEDWTGESALNFLAKFVPARIHFCEIPEP